MIRKSVQRLFRKDHAETKELKPMTTRPNLIAASD
jgi:hypothetical protein